MASSNESKALNPIPPEFLPRMDPQFVELYNKYQAPRLRQDQIPVDEYLADPAKYALPFPEGPKPEVGSAKIYRIPVSQPEGDIEVQVYHPTEDAIRSGGLKTSAGLPAHVNYHGGGWVIGSLKADESWCRQACQDVGIVVVDVNYRHAPMHPFPTQIWDAWAGLKWVFANASTLGIDSSRVSVGGLSAGGHLAAVMALLARDEPGMPPLRLQLLVVPAVDARFVPIEGSCDPKVVPYESYVSCEYAPCLPLHRMRWAERLWLGSDPEKRKERANMWIASPIIAESHANLAPASLHLAEVDPLVCEGKAYHEKLLSAGTESKIKIYPGVAHVFGKWDGELDKAKEFVKDTQDALRKAHAVKQ